MKAKHDYDGTKRKYPFKIVYGYWSSKKKYYVELLKYKKGEYFLRNIWFYNKPKNMLNKVKQIMHTKRWKMAKYKKSK